ncbi:uncharacterized protein LOC134257687 [Saccostrea cucullata]|uniref:uncharacterized protein LOC134257687 n=1 Tax=Saccostrea cuccullata TaxID=36930 RepID=UPI002ED20FF7
MEVSRFLLIALGLTICAVIFQVIGLASPYWMFIDTTEDKSVFGLWKACGELISTGDYKCSDVEGFARKNDWFKAVRAMSILGFLVLLVAAIMTGLKLFVLKDMKAVLFVAIGTAFAGAVFTLISIAVFAAKMNDLVDKSNVTTDFGYHFAFAFSIIGMIAAIGAGVIMLVEIRKGELYRNLSL